ncbi:MAG: 3-deoxy-7-phosphoheptulonate synthase [Myxococcales bacterium]|nr:3-deoxy-7-phosphoheptulonate synthase [Myxococcales bacterium]
MIVILRPDAEPESVQRALVARGLWVQRLDGSRQTQFAIEPCSAAVEAASLLDIEGVLDVVRPASPHPKLDRAARSVRVGAANFEAERPPVLIAGPCSVESEEQIHRIAREVARHGAKLLRGGAYKPRTSPYAFAGHGAVALGWMRDAADAADLGVVTEVLSPSDASLVARTADMLQIGSRNMQNFALLRAAAAEQKPILLKRGLAATVEEWLLAAEHCLAHGAPAVVLCERGIRSWDHSTRNLLDLGAVALLSHVHGLPVVVDPSHGAGRRDLVLPLARAAIAVGAAGVMVETHFDPGSAQSDGSQALPLSDVARLGDLMRTAR